MELYIFSNSSSKFKLSFQCVINYLEQYLPGYMIPSIFIKIDHIPLNQNGKIAFHHIIAVIDNILRGRCAPFISSPYAAVTKRGLVPSLRDTTNIDHFWWHSDDFHTRK